ncbi:hypothetical protein T265_03236 [Opisthorchis viverrini]|uniref:Uncharacterized protein n=1 Tax=Opisthorchis viverrini TaxID=6198 RepID=A0A075A3Z3_OPIVI|nr:hypothetical protein T265_03236 [Opisthorchis viverrini]KER30285.1 hypothetical protein T265_03236 [Opisthorchis viverrini]
MAFQPLLTVLTLNGPPQWKRYLPVSVENLEGALKELKVEVNLSDTELSIIIIILQQMRWSQNIFPWISTPIMYNTVRQQHELCSGNVNAISIDDRSFRVRIGSTYSSPGPVSIAVPQCSVLEPFLFLIYVNDHPGVLASPCLLFADDLKPWSSNASALQMDVDAAKQWSLDWHLPLNDEKCVHVSFGGDSANAFVMHGEKGPENIMRIDAKKDLGIWVSSNLSFALHHEKSAQKAFAVLRMIRRTFSRITRMDFQILYGAYVRPLLEYANQVVYSGRTKDVTLIERVQRAATRMVAGLKSVDYETRLAMLDLFPLEYRRLRGDPILTYALFERSLANRFSTVDPEDTRRGHSSGVLGFPSNNWT